MSKEQLLKELRGLPEAERWDLLGEALEVNPAAVGLDMKMTPALRAELERRAAYLKAHPDRVVTIDDALAEIDRDLKDE